MSFNMMILQICKFINMAENIIFDKKKKEEVKGSQLIELQNINCIEGVK